ncbi:Yip1 family protein [soil metagenome]
MPNLLTGPKLGPRIKGIIFSPSREWEAVSLEPVGVIGCFLRYVVPLAAIPPLAGLVGLVLMVSVNPGAPRTQISPLTFLPSFVIDYAASLAFVFVGAMVVSLLALVFGGRPSFSRAFKVVAYSATPFWFAGIFRLLPLSGLLPLAFSLYGLFIMYLGLPRLMRSRPDKAVAYMLTVFVIGIVINLAYSFALLPTLLHYAPRLRPAPATAPISGPATT